MRSLTFTIFILSATLAAAASNSDEGPTFSRKLSPRSLGLKKEKLSHLHFFFHDIVKGHQPTAMGITKAAIANSSTGFGMMMIADEPLTLKPHRSSKLVGRAQGIYASASQSELDLLMVLNFAFMEGNYNGSSLSVLGRNPIFSGEREMPIVGGTGVFKFGRGYVKAKTYAYDNKTSNAVVEYDVYVLHR